MQQCYRTSVNLRDKHVRSCSSNLVEILARWGPNLWAVGHKVCPQHLLGISRLLLDLQAANMAALVVKTSHAWGTTQRTSSMPPTTHTPKVKVRHPSKLSKTWTPRKVLQPTKVQNLTRPRRNQRSPKKRTLMIQSQTTMTIVMIQMTIATLKTPKRRERRPSVPSERRRKDWLSHPQRWHLLPLLSNRFQLLKRSQQLHSKWLPRAMMSLICSQDLHHSLCNRLSNNLPKLVDLHSCQVVNSNSQPSNNSHSLNKTPTPTCLAVWIWPHLNNSPSRLNSNNLAPLLASWTTTTSSQLKLQLSNSRVLLITCSVEWTWLHLNSNNQLLSSLKPHQVGQGHHLGIPLQQIHHHLCRLLNRTNRNLKY